jgi:hypothetical protein
MFSEAIAPPAPVIGLPESCPFTGSGSCGSGGHAVAETSNKNPNPGASTGAALTSGDGTVTATSELGTAIGVPQASLGVMRTDTVLPGAVESTAGSATGQNARSLVAGEGVCPVQVICATLGELDPT